MMQARRHIDTVRSVGDFLLELRLDNGQIVTRDYAAAVPGFFGVMERMRDPAFFARVRLVGGALTWPGNVDFNPLRTIYGPRWTSPAARRRAPKHLALPACTQACAAVGKR